MTGNIPPEAMSAPAEENLLQRSSALPPVIPKRRLTEPRRLLRWVGWGILLYVGTGFSLAVLYRLAAWLVGDVAALLICFLAFGGLVWYGVRWLWKRIWPDSFQRPPTPAPPQQPPSLGQEIIQVGVLVILILVVKWNLANDPYFQPNRPPRTSPSQRVSPGNSSNRQSEVNRQQVTLAYWQVAVAHLHATRFQTPSDTESAKEAFERLTRELKPKVQQARAVSTDNVDSDLVAMVKRHLELDDRVLSTLSQIPQLMKQHQIPVGTETAYQGALQWEEILARLRAQPELWEKLPPEFQQLVNDIVEIEHQEQEQLREIEIQQAVLQERYPNTKFSLPEISP